MLNKNKNKTSKLVFFLEDAWSKSVLFSLVFLVYRCQKKKKDTETYGLLLKISIFLVYKY